jgi:ABC-type antimicrobial peptide transport system permease subunit
LLAVFAGLAVLLASIGIYSLISYTVVLRTHEIGVRIALGARERDILKSVVGQTALLVLAGLAIGVMAAVKLTAFLSSLLFGVTATDLETFLTARQRNDDRGRRRGLSPGASCGAYRSFDCLALRVAHGSFRNTARMKGAGGSCVFAFS